MGENVLLSLSFDGSLQTGGSSQATASWIGSERYGTGSHGQSAEFAGADGASCISISGGGDELSGMNTLTLSFDFRMDDASVGRPVWMHQAYGVQLRDSNVSFYLQLEGQDGFWVDADTESLVDGDWHSFTAVFDGEEGQLSLYLDGSVVATTSTPTGSVNQVAGRDLTLGGTEWGHEFGGAIDNFKIIDGLEPAEPGVSEPAPSGDGSTITSVAELVAALANAAPQDVIELASGNYGDLDLSGIRFSDFVTIRSADGNGGAVFSSIDVDNSSRLRFQDVTVDSPLENNHLFTKAVIISNSDNIIMESSEFHGSVDGDHDNDMKGIGITRSTDIQLIDNSIHDFGKQAIDVNTSSNVIISENEIYDLRSDAINLARVNDVLIENNYMHDFYPADKDHSDFIQFWLDGYQVPTYNVTIRGNVMISNENPAQGIFVRDEFGIGFHDFLIEENVIYTGSPHGISISADGFNNIDDFTIRNNTVLTRPGSSETSIAFRNGARGVAYDNITTALYADGEMDGGGNIIVQHSDPKKPNYYGDIFIDALGVDEASDFLVVPGALIDGVGAAGRLAELGLPSVYILADTWHGTQDSLRVRFSADEYATGGLPSGPSIEYEWKFGDGTSSTGPTATHVYSDSGTYDVVLTVRDTEAGTSMSVDKTVEVLSPLLVDLTFDGSLANLGSVSGNLSWGQPDFAAGSDGQSARFGSGAASTASLGGVGAELSGMEEVTVSFEIMSDSADRSRPVWVHAAYGVEVWGSSVTFFLTTEGGSYQVRATGPNLADGAWHHVSATYAESTGTATIYVDGNVIGQESGLEGAVRTTTHGLTIGGTPWGYNFDGRVDNVRIFQGDVAPHEEQDLIDSLRGNGPPPVNNNAPDSADDAAVTPEDTATVVAVLANDVDIDGDTLSVASVSQPANGAVVVNGNGTVTYTPSDDFYGTDTFTYTVTDGQGGNSSSTVTVTVDPVNDAPDAVADVASTGLDTAKTISVLANDRDADGDVLQVASVTQAAHGSTVVNGDGTVTYTPDAGFIGVDTFTYTATDGNGGSSTSSVRVNVVPNDDALLHLAFENSIENDGWADVSVSRQQAAFAAGADGLAAVFDPTNPNLITVSGQGTELSGQAEWSISFDFQTTSSADFRPVWLHTAYGISITDTRLSLALTTEGSHQWIYAQVPELCDGAWHSVAATYDASSGTAILYFDGDMVAQQDGFVGNINTTSRDLIIGGSGWGRNFDGLIDNVRITNGIVTPDPDAPTSNANPVAKNDTASLSEDGSVTVAVLGNDSDTDGDTLSIAAVSQPSNGAVVVNGNGTVTYTPDANFHGTDTFAYTTSDGQGGSDSATVTVTVDPVNDAPEAASDFVATDEDTTTTVAVLANDKDVDGDTLSVLGATQPANGTVVVNGNGTLAYTPNAEFHGTDTFAYVVSDGQGGTDTATVTVSVFPVNDAPVDVVLNAIVEENADAGTLAGIATVIDPDANDTFTFELLDDADGRFAIDRTTGALTVVDGDLLDYEVSTSHDIRVRASDAGGLSVEKQVTVELQDLNESFVFEQSEFGSYWNQNRNPAVAVDQTGRTVALSKNTWVEVALDYNVTQATVLSFQFFCDSPAEINGIGLDIDTQLYSGPDLFMLTGTQRMPNGWGFNTDYRQDIVPDTWNDFEIEIGRYLTGDVSHLVFVHDQDRGPQDLLSVFQNIRLYEAGDVDPNLPPIAVDDAAVAAQGTTTTLWLLANDTDAERDVLTLSNVDQPANGTVAVNTDGTVDYTPNPNFQGVDTFGYTVVDGNGGSDTGVVTVAVKGVEEIILGGVGDETLEGGVGDDTIFGMDGSDTLRGNAGEDTLIGNEGDDILLGGAGNDSLVGKAGDDVLIGGEGADKIDGSGGIDTVDYSDSAPGVEVRLKSGLASSGNDAEGDMFSGVENVIGSDGDDFIEGTFFDNRLTGGLGADTLKGMSGSDTFVYHSIADSTLTSLDTIEGFDAASGDVIDLQALNAVRGANGQTPFAFDNGGALTGVAGQLVFDSGSARLLGDDDGDATADFAIDMDGLVAFDSASLLLFL